MQTLRDVLEQLEDIPGLMCSPVTARQGYKLNHFCMRLMKADNRERWRADENTYLGRA